MKKLLNIIALCLWLFSLMGCSFGETMGRSYFIWKNDSDHTIILSNKSYLSYDLENEVIPPGESLEKVYSKMGGVPHPDQCFYEITVVFDDGTMVVYGNSEELNPEVYDRKYDPRWEGNYTQEDIPTSGRHNRSRWTYTFTNADYEAAKKLSEGKE